MLTITWNKRTGVKSGKRTDQKERHAPAPSTAAASSTSAEMPCRPARKMIMPLPTLHSTMTIRAVKA